MFVPADDNRYALDSRALITDELVMPVQFYAQLLAGRTSPEKRLLLAILEDALAIDSGYRHVSDTARDTTYAWLRSDSEAPMSMIFVLQHLYPESEPFGLRGRILGSKINEVRLRVARNDRPASRAPRESRPLIAYDAPPRRAPRGPARAETVGPCPVPNCNREVPYDLKRRNICWLHYSRDRRAARRARGVS